MVEHRYGGTWTEIKLDAVAYYLDCYVRALTRTPFDLWYIDAFAGTGSRTIEQVTGGLFSGEVVRTETAVLSGSARRALAVEPPFHHFVFIEQEPERYAALEGLRLEYPHRHIVCHNGDANIELRRMFSDPSWRASGKGLSRGVVFLDPYALQVEWETLTVLANTRVLDVWYLFPLRDVVRQLAHDLSGIGPKEPRLDAILSSNWRDLYRSRKSDEPLQLNLIEGTSDNLRRDADSRAVEHWFKGRLQSIFAHVTEPLPLLTAPGRQAFSLFLAIANPSKSAVNLAKHFAERAMRVGRPGASRRRSGP